MPINFTQIFQDSLNFMRNQRTITAQFIAIFFAVSLAINFLVTKQISPQIETALNQATDPAAAELLANVAVSDDIAVLGFAQLFLTFFISAWGILTFHQLSERRTPALGDTLLRTFKRLPGLIFLNLITVFPMIIGVIEIFVAMFNKTSPSIFSLFAITLGIFVFIRLNLTTVHYLVRPVGVSETIKTVWLSGFKRTAVLFIYTLLIYFALPLLVRNLAAFGGNMPFDVLIALISAVINIFSLIFTYRFYSLFIQKA
ncbi:hypothetical protein [Caviibacterium pharyngocola]|uniref:Beta-methylgalactoside transporter n=1 Tax=Caviibacterium pharyngocola TaxID=28159 RepID=A0A2M8RWZ1_9PAST|nr:hypothetical protein [Caviibacterium pharyngocola]PJG83407.1 hypothetical protein CVP04_04600 [Caviibacterium pharyngocola]